MKELTMSQLILPLSVWRFGDNAYDVTTLKRAFDQMGAA